MKLNDSDLFKKKYPIDILEKNIKNLNKKILLATQDLTPEFCSSYIVDLDIESGSEDSYIYDFDYILYFQKHLSKEELRRAFSEQNN
jgi:hypothetical protein